MYQNTKKNIRRNLITSGSASIMDAIRTIIVANLLGPYLTGLCTTLQVIPQIAQYLNFGTIEALTVTVPTNFGKGLHSKSKELKNTVLCYTILGSTLSFVMITLYLLVSRHYPLHLTFLALLSSTLIILWELKQFFMTNYIIENNFFKLSWIELSFNFSLLIFQIVSVYWFREYGFWLGFILANLLIMLYSGQDYLKKNQFNPLKINFSQIKEILPLGIILLISSVTYLPFIIIARIFLATTVGVYEVGYFLLSIIIISKISIIPMAISKVLLPHMSFVHTGENGIKDVFRLFIKAQLATFFLCLLIIITGLIFIKPIVSFILPKYTAGIPAASIMLLAAIPYSLIDNALNVLLALQHKKIFIFNIIIVLSLQALLLFCLKMTHNASAYTVSLSFIFVFLFYTLLSNYWVFRLRQQCQ